jgi:hypothetical protein
MEFYEYLENFINESPENVILIEKLTANLNAIADQEPLPYPELMYKNDGGDIP